MPYAKLIATLSDLVRINSVNPAYANGCPERAIQRYVSDFFQRHGIHVCEQEVCPQRPNVVGRLEGRRPGRRLVFEAHSDTAGIGGMTIPPFDPAIRNGRLYGRGACDVKAGLAAMMLALVETRRSGVTLPCEIWVAATADEEHSYRGVLKLSEGLKADGAVVAEPTDLRMVVASKGCLRWRIHARGRAAHSSKPHLGVNAIQAMARVILALESNAGSLAAQRHPLVGSPTLNIGTIQGGSQVNIVAEDCWIEVDRRLIPGEVRDVVLASYQSLLDGVAAQCPGVDLTMEAPFVEDHTLDAGPDSSIARATAGVLRELGLDHGTHGVAFGSDASKLARAGIPSLILGPGSIDQAHTAEEYVEIEQVEKAFVIYRRLMSCFE